MKQSYLLTSAMIIAVASSACAVDTATPTPGANEDGVSAESSEALSALNTPFMPSGAWYGGSGGDGPNRNFCEDGYVVVGFIGRSGATMDAIGLHCASFNPDGTWHATYNTVPVGGSGGNFYSAWCPPNQWVKQVMYEYNSTVNQLGMRCGDSSSIDPSWRSVAGTPSMYIVGDDCNRYGGNNAMKGLYMYNHTYVDRVQTWCVPLTP
jgi:hypothetical protein